MLHAAHICRLSLYLTCLCCDHVLPCTVRHGIFLLWHQVTSQKILGFGTFWILDFGAREIQTCSDSRWVEGKFMQAGSAAPSSSRIFSPQHIFETLCIPFHKQLLHVPYVGKYCAHIPTASPARNREVKPCSPHASPLPCQSQWPHNSLPAQPRVFLFSLAPSHFCRQSPP